MKHCPLCKGPTSPFTVNRTFKRDGRSVTVGSDGWSCPDCSLAGDGPPFEFHTFEQAKDYDNRLQAKWLERYGVPLPPRKP